MAKKTETKKSPLIESLASYHLLGRSGLRVSPLCLGTMTFGNEQIGCTEAVSRKIYNRYLEAGGNFIDTADLYAGGESERILGRFMKRDGNRDRLVLATKFNFNAHKEDPNGGGNGRKHMMEAVESSLRRLQTDTIDLYWMHAWDTITPLEEVMAGLNNLVEQGKVRHIGFSDTPAWHCGASQMLAQLRGWVPLIALQLEYSLVQRDIEDEFVPLAQNMGMAITPWSPLGGGLLTGKFTRGGKAAKARLNPDQRPENPVFDKLSDRNLKIAKAVDNVADQLGRTSAEVALNWITRRPGVGSTIIGARTLQQLQGNIKALEFEIPNELSAKLEEASRPPARFPYFFHEGYLLEMALGNRPVRQEPAWYR